MSRPKSKVHRPNGPYLPVGDLGGEYCVKCRTPWPCPDAAEQAPNATKTMAEVLAGHYLLHTGAHCSCGHAHTLGGSENTRTQDAAHQAAALSAAGYGLVADAKREAWDEGMQWTAQLFNGDELIGSFRRDNPYRKASNDDS